MACFVFVIATPMQHAATATNRILFVLTRNIRYPNNTTHGVVRILVSWKKPTEFQASDRLERTMLPAKKRQIGSMGSRGRRLESNKRYVGCDEQARRTRKVMLKWYIAVETWQFLSCGSRKMLGWN